MELSENPPCFVMGIVFTTPSAAGGMLTSPTPLARTSRRSRSQIEAARGKQIARFAKQKAGSKIV